jgi:hypothetical protein
MRAAAIGWPLALILAVILGVIAGGAVGGCGPSVPPRFVLERDIASLSYRRYQRVLDVEFPVEGNEAVGHTATYVRRSARGEVPYVNVFVTVYANAPGLSAEIRRQVRTLGSYDVEVRDVGAKVWSLDGGEGDRWYLWVSGSRVVKIGGVADDDLVRAVVSEYLGLYPSDLDERGRARAGTPSAGDAQEHAMEEENLELPQSLTEDPRAGDDD